MTTKLYDHLCTLLVAGAYFVLILAAIRWAIANGVAAELIEMARR
jgi:HAMP domain-containing protein